MLKYIHYVWSNRLAFSLLGRIAQFIILFASVKIMTSLLEPEELGRFNLIVTFLSFFALFFVSPIGVFVNRRLHEWYSHESLAKYLQLYSVYIFLIAILSSFSLMTLNNWHIVNFKISGIWLAFLVGGSLFFGTLFNTLIPSLNLLGRFKLFTVLNVSALLFSMIVSWILCRYVTPSAEYWLIGSLICNILFSLIGYYALFKRYTFECSFFKFSRTNVLNLTKFAWPVAIASGLHWLHFKAYRFLVSSKFGLEELGFFVAGYGVAAALIAAGEMVFTTWLQPDFYKSLNSLDSYERSIAWEKYASRMIPVAILGCSAVAAVSSILPIIFLGPSYNSVGTYVFFGCCAEFGRVILGIFSLQPHSTMHTHKLLLPTFIGTGISLFGVYFSVNQLNLGLVSAPVFAAIGCIIVVLLLWVRDAAFGGNRILKIPKIFLVAAALTILAYTVNSFFSNQQVQTMSQAIYFCVGVASLWLCFGIFLRKDIMGVSDRRYSK